jgi:hypothetical protein
MSSLTSIDWFTTQGTTKICNGDFFGATDPTGATEIFFFRKTGTTPLLGLCLAKWKFHGATEIFLEKIDTMSFF